MSNRSHYQNLGLSHDAKPEAIAAAHSALTEKCHAELSPNADASRYLNAIDTALAVLSDPMQRAAYDQQLLNGDSSAMPPIKAPVASNATAAKSKNKPKAVSSIASEIASKVAETPIIADLPQPKSFPVGLGIGLAAAAGLAWFAYTKFTAEPNTPIASELLAPASPQAAAEAPSIVATPANAANMASGGENINQLTELSYDAASIDQFVGSWQGQSSTSVRQVLDISLKSPESLVFRLKTKSDSKMGDIVGVAEFENGLARFFNTEYGCRVLITRTGKQLNVNSSGCQAFYQKGAEFDGAYAKPENTRTVQTASKGVVKPNKPVISTEQPKQIETPVQAPSATSVATVKLNRFIATVKDAEGKTQRIELVAANEEAARTILRDFRGNPKVIRIRKAWF